MVHRDGPLVKQTDLIALRKQFFLHEVNVNLCLFCIGEQAAYDRRKKEEEKAWEKTPVRQPALCSLSYKYTPFKKTTRKPLMQSIQGCQIVSDSNRKKKCLL